MLERSSRLPRSLRWAALCLAAIAAGTGCSEANGGAQPPSPARAEASGPAGELVRYPGEEERTEVALAIDDASAACEEVLADFDRPISPSPSPDMVRKARQACARTGEAVERVRPLARDHEQRHAVSVCSAAFTEYEMLQDERLRRPPGPEKTQPDPRDNAVEALYEICLGRIRVLGR